MNLQITHTDLRQLVGRKIRSLRKSHKWSQETLAEFSGLSYKFIGEIERGTVNPSLDTLLSISNALKVEIVVLFSADPLLVFTGSDIVNIRSALTSLHEILDSK